MLRESVSTINTAPIHFVALAIFASAVLASCWLMKESATPAMAPESPALLPDWNRIIMIRIMPQMT